MNQLAEMALAFHQAIRFNCGLWCLQFLFKQVNKEKQSARITAARNRNSDSRDRT